MKKKNNKLGIKPCPFCGGTYEDGVVCSPNQVLGSDYLCAVPYAVHCETCDLVGPQSYAGSVGENYIGVAKAKRAAIEAWNKRVQ